MVILVHRPTGEPLFVNADLMESIESDPETVITLVDGRSFTVSEDAVALVQRIAEFRAEILVAADDLRSAPPARTAASGHLTLVPSEDA